MLWPHLQPILERLAISLTQGLGQPKRGSWWISGWAEAVFPASLTEAEGTGIQAVSAHSIATGRSAELAREAISRTAAAGLTVATGEDIFPPRSS
jgi:hypothetical protein